MKKRRINSYKKLLTYCITEKTRVIKREGNICELDNGKEVEVTFDKEYFV